VTALIWDAVLTQAKQTSEAVPVVFDDPVKACLGRAPDEAADRLLRFVWNPT
jgi:hypothetical protein